MRLQVLLIVLLGPFLMHAQSPSPEIRLVTAEANFENIIIVGEFSESADTVFNSSTGLNFDPVHSLSANLNSRSDLDTLATDLFYSVAVKKFDLCIPDGSGKKAGTGLIEEILFSDYILANVSPGINFGVLDTEGLKLDGMNFAGNPRIIDVRIDLSADENQDNLPVIIAQPAGGTFCIGDDHILEVQCEGSDTVLFNWFRNETSVVGQDKDNTLELDSILIADEGTYHCEISNSYGKVLSTTVYIKVIEKPHILVQPRDTWHEPGKPLSFHVVHSGSSPITYQWQKDGKVIPGEVVPEYRFTPVDSSQEGNYVCTLSNNCGSVKTDPAALYLSPQLCMVTVASITGHNVVVWEKKSRAPIMAYIIYREGVSTGIYDRLATISYDELSFFVDTIADPTIQAFLYKITALDTANNETDIDLCKPHKTIHLRITTNANQLKWDRYYGFEYQTYTIYKANSMDNMKAVHSLSASLNSWSDPDTLSFPTYYRISANKSDTCFVSPGSLWTGSFSNIGNSRKNIHINTLPDTILLDNFSIEENMMVGALVGRLSTYDPDTFDVHTYALGEGEGDKDNSSFKIIADLLVTTEIFDFELKESYSIKVAVQDADTSQSYDQNLSISIVDIHESVGLEKILEPALIAHFDAVMRCVIVTLPDSDARDQKLSLIDMLGKTVWSSELLNTQRIEIDVSKMNHGYYVLQLHGNNPANSLILIQ